MKNMSSAIKQDNIKMPSAESNECSSNCRNKERCLFEGWCLKECMINEAKVTSKIILNNGTCEGEFKYHFYNNKTKLFK